jgi:hypothetical protein
MDHVNVDESAVSHDLALGVFDETHAPHICSELIDFIEDIAMGRSHRCQTVRWLSQIEKKELIGCRLREFGLFEIHSPYPIPFPFQSFHQMTSYKTACATDQGFSHR